MVQHLRTFATTAIRNVQRPITFESVTFPAHWVQLQFFDNIIITVLDNLLEICIQAANLMDIISSARSRSVNLRTNPQRFPFSRSNTAEFGSLVWKFDPDNHYLHSRWVNIIYRREILLFLAISIIPLFITSLMPPLAGKIYYLSACVLIWIPFMLGIVLSFNRDARGFILASSEFWIKIAYAIALPVLLLIKHHYSASQQRTWNATVYLKYVECVLDFILVPLLLVVVGGVDAIPKLKYQWKAGLMAMVALFYSIAAVSYQILVSRDADYVVTIAATGSEISIVSQISNVYGMLSVFLWKQVVDVIRNKDRCTSITYRPYLQWIKPGSGSPLIDDRQEHQVATIAETEVVTGDVNADDNIDFCSVGI